MDPYVIVGNGVAAVNAIEAIRARGDTTPIQIFTDQECAFYSRPSLYYIMLGRIHWADAWGRPPDFYDRSGAELHCGTTVRAIDASAHTLEAADSAPLRYSRLLLATGTRGRFLPWAEQDLDGLVTLNTLADVVALARLLADSRGVVVVGGGLTSIELVEVCRHWGVQTTFVMRSDRFLDRQLTFDEAEMIHSRLRAGGVEILTEEELISVEGRNGRVARATTKSGRHIVCDIAACTIGVVSNQELAAAAGAETERGIVVDDHMRTSSPDVYAAGDAARVRRADGSAAPSEMLWYVAAGMGRTAGANVAGGDETYRPRAFLNVAEFCGLDFCGVGRIDPAQAEVESVVIRDRDRSSVRLVMRDGVLLGACFLGDIRLADIARGVIAQGTRLAELRADHPLRLLLEMGSP